MSERQQFLEAAQQRGVNLSALCRAYGISRKTGYKWLKRAQAGELREQSRRPKRSPAQTAPTIEAKVLQVRAAHPAWGGRKIRRVLQNRGEVAVPAASTISAILHRNGCIDPQEGHKHTPYQRFERERPNELWQMDFKGYFALALGGYCHPLTILDDYSRFLVGLRACPNEAYLTVQGQLRLVFQECGLPEGMLMDNGSPWGDDRDNPYTILTVWLLRLGILVLHGRPFHPQTQGKEERLNRTLLDEVIARQALTTLSESQTCFDAWRQTYNCLRPHDALDLATPSTRYEPSPRPFPAVLPPILYPPEDLVRKVDDSGKISFHNRSFRVGKAFRHQPVALRPTATDGLFDVFYCKIKVKQVDLRQMDQP